MESYGFTDLALVLSKQYQVAVSTAMEFITKNKKRAFKETIPNQISIMDLEYIEKNMKDPVPPKF